MSDKSDKKRSYILEEARKVFAENGYAGVTMKDIVEACNISRGGLYLYFSGVEEIFTEILRLETLDSDEAFDSELSKNTTAGDILTLFLKEQKKEILQKKGNLSVAVYEYFFRNKTSGKKNFLRSRFDEAVIIIDHLLCDGMKSGEFYCEDTKAVARNMMYVIEGLKISSRTMGLTSEMIDREFLYLMKSIVVMEE